MFMETGTKWGRDRVTRLRLRALYRLEGDLGGEIRATRVQRPFDPGQSHNSPETFGVHQDIILDSITPRSDAIVQEIPVFVDTGIVFGPGS